MRKSVRNEAKVNNVCSSLISLTAQPNRRIQEPNQANEIQRVSPPKEKMIAGCLPLFLLLVLLVLLQLASAGIDRRQQDMSRHDRTVSEEELRRILNPIPGVNPEKTLEYSRY